MDWKLALNFHSENLVIFNPADVGVKNVKETLQKGGYHIYLICKRKKLYFENTVLDGDFYTSTFYFLDEKHNKMFHRVNHSPDLIIESCFAGGFNITYRGQKGSVSDFILINEFYNIAEDSVGTSEANSIPSDLEVMYVGQSFGRNKARAIDARLTNHEKLQRISLEILKEGSNEEVLVIGIRVSTNDMGMALAQVGSEVGGFSIKDMFELRAKAAVRIIKGQELTVFEAALINYFQPQYNKEYKISFPSPDFSSYSEIYNTDFDYVSMTVDTKPIMARLFSHFVPVRKYIHYRGYSLTSNVERDVFFQFLK